ncbi:MAG: energy transducer TonB [Deltaproteobacteria bacterium]|nr:energy transducer TonB [Deltaproteobacteria bacterium]
MDPRIKERTINPLNFAGNRAVLKTCLAVSVLLHIAMLLCIQKAFPVSWISRPVQTFEVELLRPPVDPLAGRDEAGTDLAASPPPDRAPPRETEDTISLDTSDKRYSSYAKVIKSHLARYWEYPVAAKENLIEGQVLALFTLNRRGELTAIRILAPSRADILNTETTRTILAAEPFPPFPESVAVAKLNIKANFAYRLTTRP